MKRRRGASYTVRGPDGTIYPSAAEAAVALGISRNTVYGHLHKYGHLENVGKKARPYTNFGREIPITVCGKKFRSKTELSLWLGYGRDYVKTLLAQDRNGLGKLQEKVMVRLLEQERDARIAH